MPHAGFVYSGPIAATGYKCLASRRDVGEARRALGPAHRALYRGIATSGAEAFVTPLGAGALDREAVRRSRRCSARAPRTTRRTVRSTASRCTSPSCRWCSTSSRSSRCSSATPRRPRSPTSSRPSGAATRRCRRLLRPQPLPRLRDRPRPRPRDLRGDRGVRHGTHPRPPRVRSRARQGPAPRRQAQGAGRHAPRPQELRRHRRLARPGGRLRGVGLRVAPRRPPGSAPGAPRGRSIFRAVRSDDRHHPPGWPPRSAPCAPPSRPSPSSLSPLLRTPRPTGSPPTS